MILKAFKKFLQHFSVQLLWFSKKLSSQVFSSSFLAEESELLSTTLVDCWDVFLCAGASGQHACHGPGAPNDAELFGGTFTGPLAVCLA